MVNIIAFEIQEIVVDLYRMLTIQDILQYASVYGLMQFYYFTNLLTSGNVWWYTHIKQSSWGQHGTHLGPTGPSWAPCWPHESCYQGRSWSTLVQVLVHHHLGAEPLPEPIWVTNLIEIFIKIWTFSSKKLHLNKSSAKWQPFCTGLNVLTLI